MSLSYREGILFYDAASGRVFIVNQASLSGAETVLGKLPFDWDAASSGLSIKRCPKNEQHCREQRV